MPMPAMLPVDSSNVASIGYDPGTETLYVSFKGSGRTYSYAGVPEGVYESLKNADSVGGFFSTHIRNAYKTTPFA